MADAKTYDWQVPEYRVIFEGERKCGSCLVIPVINEGERILSLLGRIQKSDAAGRIDVIIVDGGSTDGSLEPERLKSLGVNTLILKTGPGKLSAQLLCGYAWALEKGYQGILTIDGNDKDDPAPISLMLSKLAEGYDFVQASRFIKGGVGENTPASRSLAIRLIHAPLLSLASGSPRGSGPTRQSSSPTAGSPYSGTASGSMSSLPTSRTSLRSSGSGASRFPACAATRRGRFRPRSAPLRET